MKCGHHHNPQLSEQMVQKKFSQVCHCASVFAPPHVRHLFAALPNAPCQAGGLKMKQPATLLSRTDPDFLGPRQSSACVAVAGLCSPHALTTLIG